MYGQLSGLLQDIRTNVRPDTGYPDKCPAGYRISGQIFGRIQDTHLDARPLISGKPDILPDQILNVIVGPLLDITAVNDKQPIDLYSNTI